MIYQICMNQECEKYDNVVKTRWTFCPYCGMKLIGITKRKKGTESEGEDEEQ